jgi:hypothetical protein
MTMVETNILAVLGGERFIEKDGEHVDVRMRRLAIAVAQLPDKEFVRMCIEAQDWCNDAVRAIHAHEAVPVFPTKGPTFTKDLQPRTTRVTVGAMMPDVFAGIAWARFKALQDSGFNSQQAMDLTCASVRS